MIFHRRGIDWPLVIFCLALIGAVAMAAITVTRSAMTHRDLADRSGTVR